ncbi:MAG: retropepsin-like aspartic protease [Caulobacteraceae bacterium]
MRSTPAGFKSGHGGEGPADLLVRLGPTIQVDIGLKSRTPPGEPPDLPEKRVKALIDTGAGGDCIDDALARRLGLPIHDEGEISGVGGRHRAFIYTARIYVPKLHKLLFQPFTGVRLFEGEQWHRVILGRSFLRQYRLAYDGITGQVEIIDPDR